MKKIFLLKTILFLIPLFVIAVVAETFVRSIPNSYRYKKEWMDVHKDSVYTLLLGDSHIFKLSPSNLKNSFNLSNVSQQLEYDYWLLSKYFCDSLSLRTVILSFDYHSAFFTEFENKKGADWNKAIYYNLYMDYPKHSCLSKYHYEIACPRFMLSKIGKFSYSQIKGKEFDMGCDSLGRDTMDRRVDFSDKHIKKRVLNLDDETEKINFNRNVYYLEKTIEFCNVHKIRILLINTPYWHRLNENLPHNRLEMIADVVSHLKDKYNVEYLDYREDKRFTYCKEYFRDPDHLSFEGAERFMKILTEENNIH